MNTSRFSQIVKAATDIALLWAVVGAVLFIACLWTSTKLDTSLPWFSRRSLRPSQARTAHVPQRRYGPSDPKKSNAQLRTELGRHRCAD
jgi:hypothetical protein